MKTGDRVRAIGTALTVAGVTSGGAIATNDGQYFDPARLVPDGGAVPSTAAAMLDLLDRFLSRGDDQAGMLQDVISAFRGPDEHGARVKRRTTTAIRKAALPLTGAAMAGSDEIRERLRWRINNAEPFDASDLPVGHFRDHAVAARDALAAMGKTVTSGTQSGAMGLKGVNLFEPFFIVIRWAFVYAPSWICLLFQGGQLCHSLTVLSFLPKSFRT